MENDHENQLLPRIAKAVGVPVSVLVNVGYKRDGVDVWFRNKPYQISFDDVQNVGEDE
jgi:hypothetical protein